MQALFVQPDREEFHKAIEREEGQKRERERESRGSEGLRGLPSPRPQGGRAGLSRSLRAGG